jgi:hypothetical protein
MTEEEAEGMQICIARNRPYGDERWQKTQARQPIRFAAKVVPKQSGEVPGNEN